MTAVEWFNEEINKLNVGTDARVFITKLFEQAKEKFEQQIIDAYSQGSLDTYKKEPKNGQGNKYYNETLNK